jgi:hypothetical protein
MRYKAEVWKTYIGDYKNQKETFETRELLSRRVRNGGREIKRLTYMGEHIKVIIFK